MIADDTAEEKYRSFLQPLTQDMKPADSMGSPSMKNLMFVSSGFSISLFSQYASPTNLNTFSDDTFTALPWMRATHSSVHLPMPPLYRREFSSMGVNIPSGSMQLQKSSITILRYASRTSEQ